MNQVENELKHYGVLGMHWGKRKYENPDGSLTSKGKDKISAKYKKLAVKSQKSVNAKYQDTYAKAYNKTVDEYNDGKTQQFNKTHSAKSKTYMDDYDKAFSKDFDYNFRSMMVKEIENDVNYKKAQELVKKYNMTTFDELAKQNEKDRKIINKNLKSYENNQ